MVLEGVEPSSSTLAQLSRVLGTDELELVGLFVEDENLYRAIRLPVFREISLTGDVLTSDHDRLQRDIGEEIRRLSDRFESSVRTFRYRCHIEVVRGHRPEMLSEAAERCSLVLVTRAERSGGLRHRTASEFERLLKSGRNVLIVNEPWSSGRSVVVLGADPLALKAGQRIALPERLSLVVVLTPGMPVPTSLPEGTVVLMTECWSEDSVIQICQRWEARLLVVSDQALSDVALAGVLDRTSCSLLRLC